MRHPYGDPMKDALRVLAAKRLRQGGFESGLGASPKDIVRPPIGSGNRIMSPREIAALMLIRKDLEA